MRLFWKIAIPAGLAALFAAGAFIGTWYEKNRRPNFSEDVEIFVRPGMTVEDIIDAIPGPAVMRRSSFVKVMRANLEDKDIKPGHYLVGKSKPSVYVPRMLRNGWQTPVTLVLSGTMRLKGQIARKVSNQLMLDSATVRRALDDNALLSAYGFDSSDVFSLFIPDSYQMYWTASVEDLLDKQKKAYDSFWSESNLKKAADLGLSPKEVSIVASIVKSESNHEPEYPSIAGVYLNRLCRGMRLQADPTVAFCFDYSLNRVLFKHLEVDSPYNTYLHEGLPPGPICVPDKSSLEAVLNPDKHPYIYFCASPQMDGTHRFAVTLSEHERNASQFRRALDLRAAARRSAAHQSGERR